MSDVDNDRSFREITLGEPYAFFRARVRETFATLGWICLHTDEEADFWANGRWFLYASPGDDSLDQPFHSVVLLEFPTEADRRRCTETYEDELTKATLHRELSAAAARDLITELDSDVVREA